MSVKRDLTFVDSETTGLTAGHHEIIEVAAIRCSADGREILETYVAKVLPLYPERASPKALEVNGFTAAEWEAADDLRDRKDVARELDRITRNTHLVAQNVAFDEGFLTAFLKGEGVWKGDWAPWHYHKICTMVLSWPLYQKGLFSGLSLSNLCEGLGIEPEPQVHRALKGAQTCRAVFLGLMDLYEKIA